MPLVRTRALILHAFPYGDTSRILRLLTPEFGLRSVIAKGAQRPKNRFGGILEPFTEGEAQFNLREGRDLFTLSGFSLLRSRQGIGRDLATFAGASLLAEIVLRTGTEEPNPRLFTTVLEAFDTLANTPHDPIATALSALWHVVSIIGFHPEMESCVGCGLLLQDDESSRLDVQAGGAACRSCRPAGRLIDGETRREIAQMSAGSLTPISDHARNLHAAILRAFLSTHLELGRPLRALPLFVETLR